MADFKAFPCFGEPAMEFTDRVLKCIDCGAEFVFTAGEQLFFHDKQFKNDPKHCKQCKAKRVRGGSRVRPETRTRCAQCGEETTVPFKPTQGRPVLCRSCFQKQKPQTESGSTAEPPRAPSPEPLLLEGN
jgi:CxxC-x17-CxxC domain-containing protein